MVNLRIININNLLKNLNNNKKKSENGEDGDISRIFAKNIADY